MSSDVGSHRLARCIVSSSGLSWEIVQPNTRHVQSVERQDGRDPPDVPRAEPDCQVVGLSEKSLRGSRSSVRVVRSHQSGTIIYASVESFLMVYLKYFKR